MSDRTDLQAVTERDGSVLCSCGHRTNATWVVYALDRGVPRAPDGGFYCSPGCFHNAEDEGR